MTAKQLADHLARSFTGPMWHGPSPAELLASTTCDQAAARPIAEAHSIWELVLHMSVWAEIAEARLRGERLDAPSPEDDWPAQPEPTPEAWAAAVGRLSASHATLAQAVGRLSGDALAGTVPGQDPVWAMLHGIVEHACYHAGQIAILKKAL